MVEVRTDNPYQFTAASDRTLVAEFAPDTYTLSCSVSPAGAGTVTGAGTYSSGQQVTVTAVAAPGWHFVYWDDGPAHVYENPYTFNVLWDKELVAHFAANTFYFAEGYTGKDTFEEYLCLMNPNEVATTAHITYMFADGSTKEQDLPIGKTSRATVNVKAAVGENRDVSVKVTSDLPIVCERPMYFNYAGGLDGRPRGGWLQALRCHREGWTGGRRA
ncbi:hypothetical protein [Candidatus Solincola tengchongensis]|uniref:InlB B-repeat-containing protein n=1 Tax=Candidatus Solincola tengchongensis TaxID=2900693 RepID=UPI00257CE124